VADNTTIPPIELIDAAKAVLPHIRTYPSARKPKRRLEAAIAAMESRPSQALGDGGHRDRGEIPRRSDGSEMRLPTYCLFCNGQNGRHYQDCFVSQPAPVSVEACAQAIIESDKLMDSISFVNEDNKAKDVRHAKAVLDAAGVAYVN